MAFLGWSASLTTLKTCPTAAGGLQCPVGPHHWLVEGGGVPDSEVQAAVDLAVAQSTAGMVPETEVQAAVDAATAGMVPESEVQAAVGPLGGLGGEALRAVNDAYPCQVTKLRIIKVRCE